MILKSISFFVGTILEPQIDSFIEKQTKDVTTKELKLSPEDIQTYTGALGSWSSKSSNKT
jgi:hypothetical protein